MSEVLERTCSIPGCPNPWRGKDWCEAHYKRWYRYGDPLGSKPRKGQRVRQPRLPMQPLIDKLQSENDTSEKDISCRLQMDNRYFRRLRINGLTPTMADKLAVKFAHLHPGSVWGDAWWDLDKAYAEAAELESVA